jgi:hypothetical protein
MLALAHWLTLAGKWARRCPRLRQATPQVEPLEGRIVPSLLGQELFPADYPWNQDITNAPVAGNSASVIAHIGNSIKIHPDWGDDSPSNGNNPLYGIPFNVVHGNAPSATKVNVQIDNYPGESDLVPVPIPANAVIEGDYQSGPNPNGGGYNSGQRGDSHLIVWDEDNNIAYELYGATRPSDPTQFPNTNGVELSHTDGQWHAAQESVWNMNTDSFRPLGNTSADAAGLSILAGLARPDEGLPTSQGGQGAIDHALRFTLPSGDVSPQYIYPASHMVSDSSGANKLPFGARLRLMNTPAVNNLINNLGPQAEVIARAMQHYGLMLADIGSAMYVTGTSASQDSNNYVNFTWNMNDVLGLSSLTAADFQVVDLTPQVTGLSANNGAAGNTITVSGQNFSGAAGHLMVFFGSNAASSVTYVDDGHLTAVVPNGSGTVNVQVQSGINANDPNNPQDNVNNPIFGYGISAVSSNAQFTYGAATINGSNSTANLAVAIVALGIPDTLTINVVDTAGNAVGGLASSAFGMALAGGSSTGTFGAVTETTTRGTYTASFTGTTAGTAESLTVSVNGITLGSHPSITVTSLGSRGSGLPSNVIATAADAGGGPQVDVYDAASGAELMAFMAYDPHFLGGVRVAVADVNGDGVPDIITGAGPGGGPEVKVFDGKTGALIRDLMAFDPNFHGGVYVAAADMNGDGFADIIVGADAGGGPEVTVFSGKDGSVLRSFFAFDPNFHGGVRVAAGDVNGDGKADIITGAGAGGGPAVTVFSGADGSVLRSYFAFDPHFHGGVYVAAGDVNGDGKADIITGAGPGGGPAVLVHSGPDGSVLQSFFAFAPAFAGGVRVAAASGNGSGRADIVLGAGPGGGPALQVVDDLTLAVQNGFFAFDPNFPGGIFVGGH